MNSDFHPDQILAGRYRILSLLGQGGMGVVYKVEQIFLGKELALKTIVKSEQTESILRRFQTEARAVFSVNHPNIIALHDFGVLDDETPFMAMELVNGKTLGEILKDRQLSVEETIPVFIQVCFGLAHAHESGVVHRDIKPNNIMILNDLPWGTEGSVKILDFGIAKLTQHEGGEIQALTRTGEIFGSPFYMSPEQCLGGKIDHRSDIYSLGCVLFETLTGTPPFVGDNALSTMMMHQSAIPPTLKEASLGREFPSALEQIVQTMLAKKPEDRYQNLGFAAHDLADLKHGGASNLKHGGTQPSSLVVNIPRPAKAVPAAPDMVRMQKSHFYSMLLATAAFCGITTSLVMLVTQPLKPKPATAEIDTLTDVSMNFKSNGFKEDILNKIQLNSTKFAANDYPTDKMLEAFSGYEAAQFVELQTCKVSDAGFKNLQKSKILELILCGDKNITSVDEIAKLEYLQKLDLSDTEISDEALPKLAKLPMLEELYIEGCKNISEAGLTALTTSKSLKIVKLTENKYNNGFINQLRTKLPQCVFLPYFFESKVDEEQEKVKLSDPFRSTEHAWSFVSKANPLCRSAAENLLQMGVIAATTNRLKEGWELVKRAEKISEGTRDWKELSTVLKVEAAYLSVKGNKQQAVAISDRSVQMDIDTTMHDQRKLLTRILEACNTVKDAGQPQKVIEYCEAGIKIVNQFPRQFEGFLPTFYERIAWSYYELRQPKKGARFARLNLDYWRLHQNDQPRDTLSADGSVESVEYPKHYYARALIEMGHAESDPKKAKQYYDEALELLDSLHWPEDLNLDEHYSDVCNALADKYYAEHNPAESIRYLKRALAVIKQMKHPDANNRVKQLTDKIATYSAAAK